MEAVLVVDIGNTNIVCGIYKEEKLSWFARFQSSRKRTADEYFSLLEPLLKGYELNTIAYVALGSVVPELSRIWLHLFQKYSSAKVVEINAYSDLGLKYPAEDPGFIGSDLVANAYAAWQKYQSNCLIVDLGTATTIQLVSSAGDFIGTAIAPGLKTGAQYLFENATLLSEIELSSPTSTLGTNTREALLSGIVSGHALMLEAFLIRLKEEYKHLAPIKTIITGGIADLIFPLTRSVDLIDKTLTLDGLFLALKREIIA
ncbi:MAG: type III pantothenate kinase [Candidatus Cloacimonetes bacterium]|nr:type III pantothenate kinase [Candidatus Cloacimonadota bacterium]